MNLFSELKQAAKCARQIALEKPVQKRDRLSTSGAGRSTGLRAKVLELLPSSADDAIYQSDVAKLLADFPHAYSGISSSLANLVKTGQAKHVGDKGAYRYYRSDKS